MLYAIPIAVLLTLGVFVWETIAYLCNWPSYYRLGPPFHRESWQTNTTVERAADSIDASRVLMKLNIKRAGECFLIRFRWWELSTWPRITLRLEPSAMGAVLVYEVRPFVSMAVFFIALILSGIFVPSSSFRMFSLVMVIVIALAYAIGWWLELRRLNRLSTLIRHLASIGVQACAKCGYDRHRLPVSSPCPECGAVPDQPSVG